MAQDLPHPEKHFTASESVRDVIIGMSDGLTVPFALAAGLTGAVAASNLVVTAGLAEIAAGSISMGLGGYLAARSDAEHYERERRIEEQEIKLVPEEEEQEVRQILTETYRLPPADAEVIVRSFKQDHDAWIDFMMLHELGLEKPHSNRARISAATIAGAYVVGGFVPLAPYFFIHHARQALIPSVIVTIIALGVFGFFKAYVSGTSIRRSVAQTVSVGGIAAAAAFILARLIAPGLA